MDKTIVIGAGPAGLMAAETLAERGARVTVIEAKPSVARKLLMAGKSGLNLTRAAPLAAFCRHYGEAEDWLRPMLADFSNSDVITWAEGLGQAVFTGSSGRVFPKRMKASPLLRAWLGRLAGNNVTFRTRWRWCGWDGARLAFETPEGRVTLAPKATVLALGGASWPRLGSDGTWARFLGEKGVEIAPFLPANAGLIVNWSDHMARFFGLPVKACRLIAKDVQSRGEFVITNRGLEGGGIYEISKAVRGGATLALDMLPDLDVTAISARLAQPRGKATHANHMRKRLSLSPVHLALIQEFARPLPHDPPALAARLKAVPLGNEGLAPLAKAISTAGGIGRDALTPDLMLTALPGVFAAGEMLDWEAPTGGYLLTACLATGRRAGLGAARFLDLTH